jgi:hypothetical protein
MSAQLKVAITLTTQGLGKGTEVKDAWTSATAPSEVIHSEFFTQTTANVAQPLYVGDSTSALAIMIRAESGDVAVDLNYVSSFKPSIVIAEGTSQLVCPAGVVYFKNNTADETVTIEYAFCGA